jgi:hypothetical protein
MLDVLLDSILDTIKLLPFLYLAFLLIEYIEHKLKNKKILKEAGKFGPFWGAILGGIPQCGFAASATSLYITRIISLGTLIAVYLSTSDEMLPIMLSEKVPFSFAIKVVLLKVLIGMLFGFIIDLIYHKVNKANYSLCQEEKCHCDTENIFLSSLKHTFNIALFILIFNIILNALFHFGGEDFLSGLLLKNTIFGSFITALIGLIPNCGASVIITELYINNAITLGALIGGLLTGSGIALVILFKQNKNMKENLTILSLVYLIGSFVGLLIDLF